MELRRSRPLPPGGPIPFEASATPADGSSSRGVPAGGLHATAVAINGRALVIRGASGSGKSTLALALVAASRPGRRIVLVGDDRVLLSLRGDGRILARPHPRTAGFIERRGLGLVAMPWRERAPVAGRVEIAHLAESEPMAWAPEAAARLLDDLPVLRLARGGDFSLVLDWWRVVAGAADRSHTRRKRCRIAADRAK